MKIKAVVFDADGVVINSPGCFSAQYQKEFGISNDVMLPFFKGRFQDCLVGKADLKEELKPLLKEWEWKGTVDELLDYWFKSEHYIDDNIIGEIKKLRELGVKCYLGTKQEKYRTEYIKKDMGFDNFFDGIYSSVDGYSKNDKNFYRIISQDLYEKENINSQEIMFWDDDQENVDVASECGWNAFFYTSFDEFQDKMIDIFV
jgi:putative hydrolase of the HAD superfamily